MSLHRLYSLDRSFLDRQDESDRSFPDRLNELLHDSQCVYGLLRVPDQELSRLVDHLNEILVRLDPTSEPSRKCLQVLRKICGSRKVLPTTYDLSEYLSLSSDLPIAHGGFCDVYEGNIDYVKVCIKRFRIPVTESQGKIEELFCKEAVVWENLNHPNIVPFKGVTFDPLQLLSEWMPNGELRSYVKHNTDTNLLNLLLDIAQGLAYLHSRGVIHGDLKGSNIMIDESGNARITDFGLAKVARYSDSSPSTSEGPGQTLRWTAPEILEFGKIASEESDVYSFAMVMIEVFTGDVPFKESKSSEVPILIIRGERPERPSHPNYTDKLWKLTQRCWARAADDRPKMEDVLKELNFIKFSAARPRFLDESPRVAGSPVNIAPCQPITKAKGGKASPPCLVDDIIHRSVLLPTPPPEDEGDTRFVRQPIGKSNGGSSSINQSGSSTSDGFEEAAGRGDEQSTKSVDTDRTFAAGGPPPVLLECPPAPEDNKRHGIWCRSKRHMLYALKSL